MTEEELYNKLMFDKNFNNLSPVTKEKLFNSYIKPLLDAMEVLNKDYSDELINSEDLASMLNTEKTKIKKLYNILHDLEKETERQKKEIERLKGLIETEFKGVWIEDRFNSFIYAEYGQTIATERANELWQQIKKKNKL